jgi:hypothetical protein
LLIGDTTASELKQPMLNVAADKSGFLSAFHQGHAEILSVDNNTQSPRFGLPEMYKITLSDQNIQRGTNDVEVHWTRLIHVAEDTLEDDVFGRPALERVWNLLIAIDKIGHGSAEMFWQNVAGMIHLNVDADVEVEPGSLSALSKKVEEALHGVRRLIQTRSADLDIVGGGTPDPRGAFIVLSSLVAASTRIPKRILFGSEQGQLASGMDEMNFLGRIIERQSSFAEPQIVRAFVDRLMLVGALKEQEYEIVWPSLLQLTDLQEAEILERRARSLRNISDAGVMPPVTEEEMRVKILGLTAEPDGTIIEKEEPEVVVPDPNERGDDTDMGVRAAKADQ